eukprot:scaffold11235_cov98-Isochrysis_galbana.AAC.3
MTPPHVSRGRAPKPLDAPPPPARNRVGSWRPRPRLKLDPPRPAPVRHASHNPLRRGAAAAAQPWPPSHPTPPAAPPFRQTRPPTRAPPPPAAGALRQTAGQKPPLALRRCGGGTSQGLVNPHRRTARQALDQLRRNGGGGRDAGMPATQHGSAFVSASHPSGGRAVAEAAASGARTRLARQRPSAAAARSRAVAARRCGHRRMHQEEANGGRVRCALPLRYRHGRLQLAGAVAPVPRAPSLPLVFSGLAPNAQPRCCAHQAHPHPGPPRRHHRPLWVGAPAAQRRPAAGGAFVPRPAAREEADGRHRRQAARYVRPHAQHEPRGDGGPACPACRSPATGLIGSSGHPLLPPGIRRAQQQLVRHYHVTCAGPCDESGRDLATFRRTCLRHRV